MFSPNALPQEDWCYLYRDQVYPHIDEDLSRELYPSETGRPNTQIKKAVSILIFMDMERHTWRGAEFLQTRRLDWLIATRTPIGEEPIDHTTLFKFFLRMETSCAARKLFEKLTVRFIGACGTSEKKQRTDSFFMHGWLQILSRYGLFKETLRVFLQNLRKQKLGLYEEISKELPGIQKRLEEGKMKPEEQYSDAGFVNGQTIVDSNERGILLEGPSSGRSQSFEKYQAGDRPLDTADFEVCVDEKNKAVSVLACPGKQAPVDHVQSEKTGKTLVHFDDSVCRECKVNTRCPVKIGTGVEATVSEMVRVHGVRRSRYRTEGRTRLQLLFASIACNVKRFIRHGILYGYILPVKTYFSRAFSFVKGFFSVSFVFKLKKQPCYTECCFLKISQRINL